MKVFDGNSLGDHGQVVPDNVPFLTLKNELARLLLNAALVEHTGWKVGQRIRFLQDDDGTYYVARAGQNLGFLLSQQSARTLEANIGPLASILRQHFNLAPATTYRLRVEPDASTYEGEPIHRLTGEVMKSIQKANRTSYTSKNEGN